MRVELGGQGPLISSPRLKVSPSPSCPALFLPQHLTVASSCEKHPRITEREIGIFLPNNQRQRRTCYALCHILYPVSAAHTSIFRMDSNSTSYPRITDRLRIGSWGKSFIEVLQVR